MILAQGVFDGLGKPAVIEYFPMPEELQGRYQYFTQADMTRLRAAGYLSSPIGSASLWRAMCGTIWCRATGI